MRVDFDASADVKPLLAGQTLGQVRLALSLAIEQAQWAVLNGNTRVYRLSLEQASTLLRIISAMITARPVACASAWKPLPSARLR